MKSILGHHVTTVLLFLGICMATYGFWGAYAAFSAHKAKVANLHGRLLYLKHQHEELKRKETILQQVADFTGQARQLGLMRQNWSFYDVNVQAPLSYEAAQEIIYQCRDSSTAYFWPISLEVKSKEVAPNAARAAPRQGEPGDVQLIVKGKFVARQ